MPERFESYGFRGVAWESFMRMGREWFIKIATGLDPDARGITYFYLTKI